MSCLYDQWRGFLMHQKMYYFSQKLEFPKMRVNAKVLNSNPYRVIPLLKGIDKNNNSVNQRSLTQPYPKWWLVKFDQSSNFRLPFKIGFAYSPVNCTTVPLLPRRLKKGVAKNDCNRSRRRLTLSIFKAFSAHTLSP